MAHCENGHHDNVMMSGISHSHDNDMAFNWYYRLRLWCQFTVRSAVLILCHLCLRMFPSFKQTFSAGLGG